MIISNNCKIIRVIWLQTTFIPDHFAKVWNKTQMVPLRLEEIRMFRSNPGTTKVQTCNSFLEHQEYITVHNKVFDLYGLSLLTKEKSPCSKTDTLKLQWNLPLHIWVKPNAFRSKPEAFKPKYHLSSMVVVVSSQTQIQTLFGMGSIWNDLPEDPTTLLKESSVARNKSI